MKETMWENWFNLLLGVWLFVSPWILLASTDGVPSSHLWNFWIVGLLVAGVAGTALKYLRAWEEWTMLVLGGWLLLSPWILGFAGNSALMWNSIIVGIAVAVSSGIALPEAAKQPLTD